MRKLNAWIIVIIVVGGIFYLSSIPGLRVVPILSQLNSLLLRFDSIFINISELIAHRLPVNMNELNPIRTAGNDFYAYAKANPIIIEFILRKIAHVVVFFILTIVIFFLLNQYTKRSISAAFLAYLITAIIAALDEYRQSFTDGRVASLIDVGIDLIGITLATLLILFAIFITKKWTPEKSPLN